MSGKKRKVKSTGASIYTVIVMIIKPTSWGCHTWGIMIIIVSGEKDRFTNALVSLIVIGWRFY